MANTIAKAEGHDMTGRIKSTHRLGGRSAWAQAATWNTFATAYVHKDGSGYVEVVRGRRTLSRFEFGEESGDVS